jgi:hypothetical protein
MRGICLEYSRHILEMICQAYSRHIPGMGNGSPVDIFQVYVWSIYPTSMDFRWGSAAELHLAYRIIMIEREGGPRIWNPIYLVHVGTYRYVPTCTDRYDDIVCTSTYYLRNVA